MSYILDALKKSEQLRQRGAAPITLATPAPEAPPPTPASYRNVLLALLLITAGISIGWLRPWQTPEVVTKPTVSSPPVPPSVVVSSPLVDLPRVNPAPAPQAVPVAPANVAAPAPPVAVIPAPSVPAIRPTQASAAKPDAEAPASEAAPSVMSMSELPQAVRQELPAIAIALHGYAREPRERIVMINNQMLRQGDQVAPGLRLEQITQDGVVLGYQGYRFHRGVR